MCASASCTLHLQTCTAFLDTVRCASTLEIPKYIKYKRFVCSFYEAVLLLVVVELSLVITITAVLLKALGRILVMVLLCAIRVA
jgi:hypothetical protein